MKYLKTYEASVDDDAQFKKYLVHVNMLQDKPLTFAILEFIDVIERGSKILTERLFLYNFQENKEIDISEENNVDSQYIFLIKKRIKFQSDNYQDCIDYFDYLKKTSKYNL